MADLAPAASGWLADYRARLAKRGRTAGSRAELAGMFGDDEDGPHRVPGYAYADEADDTGTEHRPGEMVRTGNRAHSGKAAFAGASPPGTGGADDIAARNPALLKGKGQGGTAAPSAPTAPS